MMLIRTLCLVSLSLVGISADLLDLPDNLQVGFATASYQIEGAWDEDGKGENIWDRLTHSHSEMIADRSTGDVAADSYHHYQEDIQLLKNMGAQIYRLSLSWSRILPKGDVSVISSEGIDYYNRVIDTLLENGIEPMVTLFHWDLPQPLQDIGGFANPLLADYFEDFARIVFKSYGDRVKKFITFNEPYEICQSGYGGTGKAPALNIHGTANYLCAHTLILAHARAYHIYNDEFRPTQEGLIGITLSGGWNEPKTDSPSDVEAAEIASQFDYGWFAHPIFTQEGDYPPIMRQRIDANSIQEGRPRSRLPKFTPEEVEFIKGTSDFYGMNHYSTGLVSPADYDIQPNPSIGRDANVSKTADPSWPESASSWLRVVPWGFRKHLKYIKDTYQNPIIYVTENGFSDHGELEDEGRVNYFHSYLTEMLKAIYEDQVNVRVYTAWSLIDNFEWLRGYTERFGINFVDFDNPYRERTAKKSARYFTDVIKNRRLPDSIKLKEL